jgi:alkanesulfonate monooxygenase SsuD/methylene tetrahydromethanopterin reductase-like flavin-dependent oxidoreductase (luciferase family)
MRFSCSLPVRSNQANHSDIVSIAHRGEELGFSYATIADHIVFPTSVASQQGAIPVPATQWNHSL